MRRYLDLAGINKGKHGPHLLRHTFCTRLHQKGVTPFTMKDLASHKNLNTTMRYIKIANKKQAEALDRLEFSTIRRIGLNNGKGRKLSEAKRQVFKEGDALLAKGDYVQASEKFWGAVAEAIKAIAAKRGVDIRSHGEMHRFITTLTKETEDIELLTYFSLAGALHQNFYESWLTPETVMDHSRA